MPFIGRLSIEIDSETSSEEIAEALSLEAAVIDLENQFCSQDNYTLTQAITVLFNSDGFKAFDVAFEKRNIKARVGWWIEMDEPWPPCLSEEDRVQRERQRVLALYKET